MPDEQVIPEGAPEGAEGTEGAPGVESGTPTADPFDSPETQNFPREYVERLRGEAAQHRVEAKKYKDSFEGYAPDEVEALLGLVGTLSKDPKTAAQQMQQIVESINEMYPDEEATADGEDKPLTRAEYEQLRAQETQQAKINSLLADIDKKAGELGYEKNTPAYVDLLWRANNQTNFDLDKAHEAIKADRQKVIDDYLKEKQGQADGAPVVNTHGSPAGDVEPIKTLDDAKSRLIARLKGVAGQ